MPTGDCTCIYFLRRNGLLPPGLRYGFLLEVLRSGLAAGRPAACRSGLLLDVDLANGLAPKFWLMWVSYLFLGCAFLLYGQAGHHATYRG